MGEKCNNLIADEGCAQTGRPRLSVLPRGSRGWLRIPPEAVSDLRPRDPGPVPGLGRSLWPASVSLAADKGEFEKLFMFPDCH